MKNLIVLLLGLFAFTFMGASPKTNSNHTNSIEKNVGFEYSPVLTVVDNQLQTFVNDSETITISNVIGQTLLFEANKYIVDISSLPNGLYFSKIDYIDKTSFISKFIKTEKNNKLYNLKLFYKELIFNQKPELLIYSKVSNSIYTLNFRKDKTKHLKFWHLPYMDFDTQTNSNTTSLISNIGYTDILIYVKPFEKGWSNSYIKRT